MRLVERLVMNYRRTFREEHYSGMWKGIFENHQRALHDVFMRGTMEEAAEIIGDPMTNFLHYGFENTFKGYPGGVGNDTAELHRLAEAIGVGRVVNPSHNTAAMKYRAFRRSIESADTIIARIEARIGPVEFPNPFPGESGVMTRRGIASSRAIQAIYQARLLKGRVLEIGGGLGRTAYYASRFGVTDYTIVDLPLTGVSQGYFLAKTLGEHGVRLLSPDQFFASADEYDVALNVDSLTEMSRDQAERYIYAIRRRAKTFISINHESNDFSVGELLGGRIARHPYWFRKGYVEEHFQS